MPVNDASEYVATLKSRDSAVIMPQVEGQITQIFVHSGDEWRRAEPLMEIDPLKQQATVKSQESARAAQEATSEWAKQAVSTRTQGLCVGGRSEQAGSGSGEGYIRRGPGADGRAGCAGERAGSATALLQGGRAAQRDCRRYSGAGGRPGHDLNAS